MMHEVKCLSAGQSLAEVFLIGWAFAFMVSGAYQAPACRHTLLSIVLSTLEPTLLQHLLEKPAIQVLPRVIASVLVLFVDVKIQ
jgi:hypothetical protein